MPQDLALPGLDCKSEVSSGNFVSDTHALGLPRRWRAVACEHLVRPWLA